MVSDKEGEPDLDYYLLADTPPADKEGEAVLTLVNLYQEVEEGNSSSSSAGGEIPLSLIPSPAAVPAHPRPAVLLPAALRLLPAPSRVLRRQSLRILPAALPLPRPAHLLPAVLAHRLPPAAGRLPVSTAVLWFPRLRILPAALPLPRPAPVPLLPAAPAHRLLPAVRHPAAVVVPVLPRRVPPAAPALLPAAAPLRPVLRALQVPAPAAVPAPCLPPPANRRKEAVPVPVIAMKKLISPTAARTPPIPLAATRMGPTTAKASLK